MKVVAEQGRKPIKMWTDGVPVEDAAMQQLRNVASLPFVTPHVAVMPDVHLGFGATVGSVIPTVGAIIPAAVGVDIGCGMMAGQTSLQADQLPDSLASLRGKIEDAVPVGNGAAGSHSSVPGAVQQQATGLWARYKTLGLDKVVPGEKLSQQLGTLGGGNHFIELCLDEQGFVWVMLHSGSRGIGNRIGKRFIELAKEDMRVHSINLPDKELAYLSEGTEHFGSYCDAVGWAQDYARVNRELMLQSILKATGLRVTGLAVACHHNYISEEVHFGVSTWVTRKGAVNAASGAMGIIPGSMGQRSYIVRGKGNPESLSSCSHGAGRRMSRGAATRTFTVADLERQTEGVECRKDAGVLDEIPGAYKDLDAVMAAQSDLVEVVHTLKAILTVKG
jgi:tRNA-splicing ligase RtcB